MTEGEMTPNEYQQLAARTLLSEPDRQYRGDEIMAVWNALGLAGEAGEAADHVKKVVFHQHPLDHDRLVKELGDVLWYVAALCGYCGVPLETVIERNIEKLRRRYPTSYNAADSLLRRDAQ